MFYFLSVYAASFTEQIKQRQRLTRKYSLTVSRVSVVCIGRYSLRILLNLHIMRAYLDLFLVLYMLSYRTREIIVIFAKTV